MGRKIKGQTVMQ